MPISPKRQLSDEYVAFAVLELLVLRHESGQSGCSAYYLMHHAPKLRTTQRQQRIDHILGLLEESGIVESQSYEKATYYSVTAEGVSWYKEVMKGFYSVLGQIYERSS